MRPVRWCLVVTAFVVGASAWAQAATTGSQTKSESVSDLMRDINAMAVLNLMNLSAQQMATLSQQIQGYHKVLDSPPAELVSELKQVKASLIAGMGEQDAWFHAGASKPAAEFKVQVTKARDQTISNILGILTDDQKAVLAARGTPYELFRRLVWDVGHVRDVSDAGLQAWGDHVVEELSKPLAKGVKPIMSAEQATDVVRQVRQMDDQQWQQASVRILGQLKRRLPATTRQSLDDPNQVQARMTRQILGFLNDKQLPAMLNQAIRADQQAAAQAQQGGQR